MRSRHAIDFKYRTLTLPVPSPTRPSIQTPHHYCNSVRCARQIRSPDVMYNVHIHTYNIVYCRQFGNPQKHSPLFATSLQAVWFPLAFESRSQTNQWKCRWYRLLYSAYIWKESRVSFKNAFPYWRTQRKGECVCFYWNVGTLGMECDGRETFALDMYEKYEMEF